MNNFTKRLVFGVIYVLLMVVATIYSPKLFIILFFVFMNFCIYEFAKMIKLKSILPYLLGVLIYYYINFYEKLSIAQTETKILLFVTAFLLVLPFINALFTKNKNALNYMGKIFTTYFYIVIPFSFIIAIPIFGNPEVEYDTRIILAIFILIWTSDTFAYLVGRQFGKHKLFERISPKKTIEGFVGGLLFTLIGAFILSKYFMPTIALKHWFAIAILVCVFGTLGDLIESMFKRQANIKDSSNLIPGHGGFLDRLDSIIFAAPIIFIYLILFL